MQVHEQSLHAIALDIARNPHCHSSVILRQFLWSAFHNCHVVNLFSLGFKLDLRQRKLVKHVIAALLKDGMLVQDISRAHIVSGEHRRCAQQSQSGEWVLRFCALEQELESLLKMAPPGPYHEKGVKILRLFREGREGIEEQEEDFPF